jgi:hypothetical protein
MFARRRIFCPFFGEHYGQIRRAASNCPPPKDTKTNMCSPAAISLFFVFPVLPRACLSSFGLSRPSPSLPRAELRYCRVSPRDRRTLSKIRCASGSGQVWRPRVLLGRARPHCPPRTPCSACLTCPGGETAIDAPPPLRSCRPSRGRGRPMHGEPFICVSYPGARQCEHSPLPGTQSRRRLLPARPFRLRQFSFAVPSDRGRPLDRQSPGSRGCGWRHVRNSGYGDTSGGDAGSPGARTSARPGPPAPWCSARPEPRYRRESPKDQSTLRGYALHDLSMLGFGRMIGKVGGSANRLNILPPIL